MKNSPGKPHVGRTLFMMIYMVIIMTTLLFLFNRQFIDHNSVIPAAVNRLFFFDRFIAEYFLTMGLVLFLINGKLFARLLAYFLLGVFLLVNVVQLTSLIRGGEFLSKLAIDNFNHFSILFDQKIVLLLCLILILPLVPEAIIRIAGLRASSRKKTLWTVLFCALTAAFFSQSHNWIPQDVELQRKNLFIENNIRHTSPFYALFQTLFPKEAYFYSLHFSKEDLERLQTFGFILNNDKPYPFIKPVFYQDPLPFPNREPESTSPPNIILFFTEGLSARSMSVYGAKLPDITPNLQNFADSSMVVTNYFNHTAATYRGLHGQLCSLYPKYGGNGGWYRNYKELGETHYLSLATLLNKQGYQTIFLDAHRKDKAYVDDMMRELGFQSVLTAEALTQSFLSGAAPAQGDALSDTQFYKSLVGLLKKKSAATEDQRKPFLISLYNYGTHSWVNPTNNEKKYGDGWNTALNSVHNLDHAFGIFWSYFRNSPYAENTIIVFTTDHCHYPTQSFIAGIDDPTYQRIFVDRIPLIIHDHRNNLPDHYDAGNSTSLDLTPSLLHYLGVQNQPTPFLGQSIFSKTRQQVFYGVANIEPDIFVIEGNKIHSNKNSRQHRQDLELLKKFFTISQKLEVENKLWK